MIEKKFVICRRLILRRLTSRKNDAAGLISTNYCVRYPHAVLFWINEMPFLLLKIPKTRAVLEEGDREV